MSVHDPWAPACTRGPTRSQHGRSVRAAAYAPAISDHERQCTAAEAEIARFAEPLRKLGRAGETLHLHATDHHGEWMITLGPDGVSWERGHGKGSVAVRGTTSDLLLLTYGRLRPDDERFAVFGDQELLSSWLAAAAC
jgi:hypothetical protein